MKLAVIIGVVLGVVVFVAITGAVGCVAGRLTAILFDWLGKH